MPATAWDLMAQRGRSAAAIRQATSLRLLDALLPDDSPGSQRWLDLCCGQAWHFSRFPHVAQRTGVDRSAAQLALARQRCPDADFICGDVLHTDLPTGCADLVTCFWGNWRTLDEHAHIDAFLQRAMRWTAPGGSLCIELLPAPALASVDGGGQRKLGPPLDWFTERLSPHFGQLRTEQQSGVTSHLVARHRRTTRVRIPEWRAAQAPSAPHPA